MNNGCLGRNMVLLIIKHHPFRWKGQSKEGAVSQNPISNRETHFNGSDYWPGGVDMPLDASQVMQHIWERWNLKACNITHNGDVTLISTWIMENEACRFFPERVFHNGIFPRKSLSQLKGLDVNEIQGSSRCLPIPSLVIPSGERSNQYLYIIIFQPLQMTQFIWPWLRISRQAPQ